MESLDMDIPLPVSGLTVGIIYNAKHDSSNDAEAEYDSPETVSAIASALRGAGLTVKLFEANSSLIDKLTRDKIDIAFNIAEGISGRGREGQAPAILTMLGIPYTGSDETALCVALDKALTKRILKTYRVPTPRYAVVSSLKEIKPHSFKYPVIVKPNAEGSSKGISDVSIASSPEELLSLAKTAFSKYGEDMLIEEYIEGREFTVGILGNGESTFAFEPMEIFYKRPTQGSYHVYSYSVKQDYKSFVEYKCPSDIASETSRAMRALAVKAFRALGCRDFARVDFRVDAQGNPTFIEINPLPGLAPGYSDYPMLAEFSGVPYDKLVRAVFAAGAKRLGVI